MSQTATTSNWSGIDSSTGKWITWATSPSPMTPVRSRLTGRRRDRSTPERSSRLAALPCPPWASPCSRWCVYANRFEATLGDVVPPIKSQPLQEQLGERRDVHVDRDVAVGRAGAGRRQEVGDRDAPGEPPTGLDRHPGRP